MVIYWIFGSNNMASVIYGILSTVFQYFHEWAAFMIFVLKPFPECHDLYKGNNKPSPQQVKECEYIDQLNRTAIANNQTFSPISAFVKPEKLHPVDLICTILLIFGAIPFGLMKFKQFFDEALIGNETRSLKKKQRYKRNLLRKAKIAKEIGVQPKDLTDYRMFFVGLEEQTSSGEEK